MADENPNDLSTARLRAMGARMHAEAQGRR